MANNNNKCPFEGIIFASSLKEAIENDASFLLEGVLCVSFYGRHIQEIYDPYGWLEVATPLDDVLAEIIDSLKPTLYICTSCGDVSLEQKSLADLTASDLPLLKRARTELTSFCGYCHTLPFMYDEDDPIREGWDD